MRAGVLTIVVSACTYTPPGEVADGPVTPDGPSDTTLPDTPPDTQPAEFWTAVVGADASGTSLTKTTGASTWGDSGARSSRSIASGDCFVEFSTAESTTGKALGLSHGDDSQSFNDIDFDLVLGANKKVYVYEGALLRGQFGTYIANDVFRVERVGTVVNFRRNGMLLFSTVTPAVFPLVVDAALFSPNATITGVVFDSI